MQKRIYDVIIDTQPSCFAKRACLRNDLHIIILLAAILPFPPSASPLQWRALVSASPLQWRALVSASPLQWRALVSASPLQWRALVSASPLQWCALVSASPLVSPLVGRWCVSMVRSHLHLDLQPTYIIGRGT